MISKETLDELSEFEKFNECYYRPLTYNGYATLACMQWFDEYDCDEKRFFRDENDDKYRFSNKEEGIEWLFNNIKADKIDPEYQEYNHDHFYK